MEPKYRLKEFQVSEDAVVPVGTELSAGHFVPGQFVDVQGVTYVFWALLFLIMNPHHDILTDKRAQDRKGFPGCYEEVWFQGS